jgi:hypothetical protein
MWQIKNLELKSTMLDFNSSGLHRERSRMRSLFIVSLPRSLSTVIHYQCSQTLRLRSPAWVDGGEVLNPDRNFIFPASSANEADKFTRPEETVRFAQLTEFLDDVINPYGCVYKDVVQPFVVSQWLRRRDLAVLHIRRPVAEVAWAMLKRGWMYPGHAEPPDRSERYRLITGLAKAAQVLENISAEHVDFDQLTTSEDALKAALQRLYPELEIPPINYIDRDFRERSATVKSKRCEDLEWQAFQQEVTELTS